jgi:Holliday junction resolvasome RuvABC endonuclease subunit
MNVLGLDLSLRSTGWAFAEYKNGKIKVKKYGVIVPKDLKGAERLNYIEIKLWGIYLKYNINYAFIEGYAYMQKGASLAFSIGELGGIAKKFLFTNGIKFETIQPTTLKKQFAGYGRAEKEKMIKVAKKKTGLKLNKVIKSLRNNVADAIALIYVGINISKFKLFRS